MALLAGSLQLVRGSLNPRSCAASSMARSVQKRLPEGDGSQSAFVRGFIDGVRAAAYKVLQASSSQSAFVRGFIDGLGELAAKCEELGVSIRVRARLHRWPSAEGGAAPFL